MLGDDTLLIPGAGDNYVGAVRTALLYAGRVWTTTLFSESLPGPLPDEFQQLLRRPRRANPMLLRTARYWQFVRQNHELLLDLRRRGLIHDATNGGAMSSIAAEITKTVRALSNPDAFLDPALAIVRGIGPDLPGCFADVSMTERFTKMPTPPGLKGPLEDHQAGAAATEFSALFYLLFVVGFAEEAGITLATPTERLLRSAWDVYDLLPGRDRASELSHRGIEARLAHTVLEARLPRADDLPLDELLGLRDRCSDTLGGFRELMREVASEVDPTQPASDLAEQLRSLRISRIDAAVEDVRRDLAEGRAEAVATIAGAVPLAAVSFVPFVLTLAAGPPFDLTTIFATGGAFAGSVAAALKAGIGTAAKRRVVEGAGRWGLLFQIEKAQRRLRPRQRRAKKPR